MEPIRSGSGTVYFGEDSIGAMQAHLDQGGFSRVFVLTDSNTREYCLPVFLQWSPTLANAIHLSMPAGEAHKNLDTCRRLWEELSEYGADRKSLLINLGGGVVTDLGGFVACTYQRGIAFVNVPTSLLAMVDASVGGKTGVDLGVLKNQVGVIRDPDLVGIYPEFLKTLEPRQVRSGFAEMLKHGLIQDREYWETLSGLDGLDTLGNHIHHSVQIKNRVVTADPLEKGHRKILNYGHTLGHAIESCSLDSDSGEPLLHGEAIAIGMVLEAYLSMQTCGLPRQVCDQIKTTILKFFPGVALTTAMRDRVLQLLRFDKKNAHGKVLFALLRDIGQAEIDQEVAVDHILDAFDYYAR